MSSLLRHHRRSVFYLALTDYLILAGSFVVLLHLRFSPRVGLLDLARGDIVPEIVFILGYSVIALGVFSYFDLYRRKLWQSPVWLLLSLAKGVWIIVFLYILLQFVTKSFFFVPSRLVVLAWGLVVWVLLAVHRLGFFPLLRRLVSRSDLRRRVIIIGASAPGRQFASQWQSGQGYSTMQVIGFLDDEIPAGQDVIAGLPCLGEVATLPEIVNEYNIEGAVITVCDVSYQRLMEIIEEGIALFGWVDVHSDRAHCLQQGLEADTFFDIPFVRMGVAGGGAGMRLVKRAFDLAAAALGVLVLSPLFLLTALLVKLSSPGPLLYTHERIGYRGRPFRFYKFRSLRVGADRDETRRQRVLEVIRAGDEAKASKIVNRSYMTPLGSFLRKWGLDELPQLFNVLKGDMSLVGPRPLPRDEFEANADWQKRRFDIQPGCTGLWKLYAAQREMPFTHTVLYDLYYARNMSLPLDLYILLGTVRVILTGKADG